MEGFVIRSRYFGSDTDFSAWMRSQRKELPAYSPACGFVATDHDLVLHCYLHEVDSIGTREIQSIMFLEVKTRSGQLTKSQHDTLAKVNAAFSSNTYEFLGQTIRHFGVSVLYMSDTTPDNSRQMEWGRFDVDKIKKTPITRQQLFQLMRFEIHPDNFSPKPFRRHHKTKQVVQITKSPLGFEYEEKITKRS